MIGNGQPVPELVSAQAARTPHREAVLDSDGGVTYAELDDRVARMTNILRAHGVRAGDVVGVCLERGVGLVVALLAVMRAGAAYLPLDPGHPTDRITYMVTDSAASLLLTDATTSERLSGTGVARLRVDHREPAGGGPPGAAAPHVRGELAYVIYTSGSTGRPKGVLVRHAAVTNLMAALRWRPGLRAGDVLLATASATFDMSVVDLFLPLVVGASVVVAPRDVASFPERLTRLLAESAATVMQATPTAWRMLLETGWSPPPGFRVWCGGESMPRQLAHLFRSVGATVWDLYGPTETTVWSACARLGEDGELTDWAALRNQGVHVLDGRLAPVAAGEVGEIYISGHGLAAGYLRRPALTAQRFLPWRAGGPGERLYRTGDVGRRRPDGRVEVLGRTDHQVKLNGFRIEPGEIEAVLASHPAVGAAVVHPKTTRHGRRRLVAYLVGKPSGSRTAPHELRRHVAAMLPDHMVPAAFVWLPELPVNRNGKVDRAALPEPADRHQERPYRAPRDEAEETLARACGAVLEIAEVGADDDFFELGGDSLRAVRLIGAVRRETGTELTVAQVFERRTIASLAALVDHRRERPAPELVPTARTGPLPASSGQRGLWYLHQLDPAGDPYLEPMAVRLNGFLSHGALTRALTEVVARHEVLRTVYVTVDDEPRQEIHPPRPVPLPVRDLSNLSPDERETRLHQVLADEPWRPFDLSQGPVIRALLVRMAPDDHVLLVTCHHIACDGLSLHIFARELAVLYARHRYGRPAPAPLTLGYADFTAWQRAWLRTGEAARQLAYWERRLAGIVPLRLPAGRPYAVEPGTAGASITFGVPAELTDRLDRLASTHGATPYMVFLAAFQALLGRYSGQRDVVVGSPVAGRGRVEVENLIGLFTNTVLVRTDLGGRPTVVELLDRVRATVFEALGHQLLPFDRVVDRLAPERSGVGNPLFNVMFTFLNEDEPLTLPGLDAHPVEIPRRSAKFDLSVELVRRADGSVAGELEYAAALFDRAAAKRVAGHYTQLLRAFAETPHLRVDQLDIPVPVELGRPGERTGIRGRRVGTGSAEVPPNPEVAATIAGIWADILGVDEPDTHENFFNLGGDSLSVIKMASRVRRHFGVTLTVVDVLATDTLAELTRTVAERRTRPDG